MIRKSSLEVARRLSVVEVGPPSLPWPAMWCWCFPGHGTGLAKSQNGAKGRFQEGSDSSSQWLSLTLQSLFPRTHITPLHGALHLVALKDVLGRQST